jgi:hypothetical protein
MESRRWDPSPRGGKSRRKGLTCYLTLASDTVSFSFLALGLFANSSFLDHSNMAHDCQPYWLRDQDTWTKIDYKASAKTWMKPLERGNETGMVEIPASWDVSYLLDSIAVETVSDSNPSSA